MIWYDGYYQLGILGALFVLIFFFISLIVFLAIYNIFVAYASSRLGRKFGVGSFPEFLIPVYNIMLLCDCAGVTRWLTAVLLAPSFFSLLLSWGSPFYFGEAGRVTVLLLFAASVYLWGRVAQRLGKNFWLWGIITPLLAYIPALVLAFDGSQPAGGGNAAGGTGHGGKYIDI